MENVRKNDTAYISHIFILLFFILLMIIVARISYNRNFQVDEVEHVHSSFNIKEGRLIYKDFWEGHNPAIYYLLYPIIDIQHPEITFRECRLLMLIFLFGTVALSGLCIFRFSRSLPIARVGAGFLLTNTTFIERGIEIRPDVPMASFFMLALFFHFSKKTNLIKYCLQAICLSVAFLFTQKAVFGCVAFGLMWVYQALKEKKVSTVFIPVLIWVIPVSITFLTMYFFGNLHDYLQYNVFNQLKVVGRMELKNLSFSPNSYLLTTMHRNIFFWLLVVTGFIIYFSKVTSLTKRRSYIHFCFPAFFAMVLFSSLWLNPFPFPYYYVSIIPPLSLMAAIPIYQTGFFQKKPSISIYSTFAIFLLISISFLSSFNRFMRNSINENWYQFKILNEIQRITKPNEPVFDLAGLYFRPDACKIYLMTGPMMARYKLGEWNFSIPETFKKTKPVAFIINYRTTWLPETDKDFLRTHFVYYADNIFILGTKIDDLRQNEQLNFDVLRKKTFSFEGTGTLLIDGKPFRKGLLSTGNHVLETTDEVKNGALIMETPDPKPVKIFAPHRIFRPFD